VFHAGEVEDHTFAYIATAHGAAGTPGNQTNTLLGGPANQGSEIVDIGGKSDRPGEDTIDAGTLGIRRPGTDVGTIDASDVRRRQHRRKLTIFWPWLRYPGHN
jgi:hypothetical protein